MTRSLYPFRVTPVTDMIVLAEQFTRRRGHAPRARARIRRSYDGAVAVAGMSGAGTSGPGMSGPGMSGSSNGSAGADVVRFNILCFVALLPAGLRALPMTATGELAWDHVQIAVERGLLTPADVVTWSHQATSLTVWTGQESGAYEETAVPHSGRTAVRREVRAHLAAWYADHPPAPGSWTALRAMVGTFPGTLPALLRAIAQPLRGLSG